MPASMMCRTSCWKSRKIWTFQKLHVWSDSHIPVMQWHIHRACTTLSDCCLQWWVQIRTSYNLILRIYYENVVNIILNFHKTKQRVIHKEFHNNFSQQLSWQIFTSFHQGPLLISFFYLPLSFYHTISVKSFVKFFMFIGFLLKKNLHNSC